MTLNVPIYLHPTRPLQAVIEASYGGFSPQVSYVFSASGWGWHIETAVHVIRLILGGVFDRYPTLQLVIGHLGEGLPFMLPRLDAMTPVMTKLKRPVSEYLRENVHYTVSGFNFPATFLNLLLEVGVERIKRSRSITPTARWRKPAPSWSKSRSAPRIRNGSRTAMRRSCSGCRVGRAKRSPRCDEPRGQGAARLLPTLQPSQEGGEGKTRGLLRGGGVVVRKRLELWIALFWGLELEKDIMRG